MIPSRSLAARRLFALFPLLLLAGVLPALSAAVASLAILIVSLSGGPDPAAVVAQAGGWPVAPPRPSFGLIVHATNPDGLPRPRASGSSLWLNADRLPNFMCDRYA